MDTERETQSEIEREGESEVNIMHEYQLNEDIAAG